MTNYSSARRDWKLKAFKVAHAFMLMRDSDMICMRKRRVWGLIAAPAIFSTHIFLLSALFGEGREKKQLYLWAKNQIFSVNTHCWSAFKRVCVLSFCSRPPEAPSCTRSAQSGHSVRFCHIWGEKKQKKKHASLSSPVWYLGKICFVLWWKRADPGLFTLPAPSTRACAPVFVPASGERL